MNTGKPFHRLVINTLIASFGAGTFSAIVLSLLILLLYLPMH